MQHIYEKINKAGVVEQPILTTRNPKLKRN